ncbi:MAG: methylmalonyl-CoA mutase family protein [Bacteroidota bacterium]
MSKLFASFPPTSKHDWLELLQKELKGESMDKLQKFNRIEEISLPAYLHREDQPKAFSDPGLLPYTRGSRASSNDWHIGSCFRIENEQTDNKQLLEALMAGTTALVIHATSARDIDFKTLFSGVDLEYIHTTFYSQSTTQAAAFLSFLRNYSGAVVAENSSEWLNYGRQCASLTVKPFAVQANLVQQSGGTTWQELSIALAEGHDLLVAQLELGLSVDEASANIHFIFGIGNQYFYEIAKLRAFRMAWARIVSEYTPEHDCSHAAYITSQTGCVHTSLKDPYTNLLRQTTEAMSAVVGGVQQLVIQPYDWHATNANTAFTQRMATNISLVLKEESYLDKVIDPSGGSYAIDDLTNAIAERAWTSFQWIEANGGLADQMVVETLSAEIREKAQQRVTSVREKKSTLIGINAFLNPDPIQHEWHSQPSGWKTAPALIIESEISLS